VDYATDPAEISVFQSGKRNPGYGKEIRVLVLFAELLPVPTGEQLLKEN